MTPPWRWFNTVLTKKNTVLAKFNTVLMKKNTVLAKFNTVLAKFNTVLTKKNTAEFSVIFSYSVDSSLGRVPACNAGGPGSIPGGSKISNSKPPIPSILSHTVLIYRTLSDIYCRVRRMWTHPGWKHHQNDDQQMQHRSRWN